MRYGKMGTAGFGVVLASIAGLTGAGIASPSLAAEIEAPPSAQGSGDTIVKSVLVQAPRKVDLPLLTEPLVETPQTITLITAQMISLQGVSDLRDVLRFDPSVSAHADEDSGLQPQ